MGKAIILNVKNMRKLSDNLEKYRASLITHAINTIDKTCKVGLLGNYESASQLETKVEGSIVRGGIKAPKEVKFAEYGTGVYAEKNHIGTTKTFNESGYNKWFVPVGQVTHSLGYPIVSIQGEEYYMARPQRAQHLFEQKCELMRSQIKQIAQDEFIGGADGITKYLQ